MRFEAKSYYRSGVGLQALFINKNPCQKISYPASKVQCKVDELKEITLKKQVQESTIQGILVYSYEIII